MEGQVHQRHLPAELEDGSDVDLSDDDEENGPATPTSPNFEAPWLDTRPFLYNRRMLLPFLPGFILVLSITGEMLLTLMIIGALCVHLLDSKGEKYRAVVVFLVVFVCCQLTIVYSAVPLIWQSMFNILFIMALNMFSILSGAWFLLQFPAFRLHDTGLAKVVEMFLFSLYPGVSVALMTWVFISIFGNTLAPFFLLIYGFVVLQMFLVPTMSSFSKKSASEQEEGFILLPEITGMTAMVFCAAPPSLGIVIHAFDGFNSLFTLTTLIQVLFLASLSVFLVTLLSIRPFLDSIAIPWVYVSRLRWLVGALSLFLLSPVLEYYQVRSNFLTYLPLGIAIHAAYGILANQKNKRMPVLIAAVIMMLFYAYLFTQLPWRLKYDLSQYSVHVNLVYLVLFLAVFVSVVLVFTSSYAPKETFGFMLICQSIMYVICEGFLQASDLFPVSLMLLTLVFAAYVLLRMHYTEKVSERDAWISLSIHLTKLMGVLHTLVPNEGPVRLMLTVYRMGSMFAIVLVASKLMLFDQRDKIPEDEAIAYFIALGVSTLAVGVSYLGLFQTAWVNILGIEPLAADILGSVLLLWGLLYLQMTLTQRCPTSGLKHLSPLLITAAIIIFSLRPEIVLSRDAVVNWSLVISAVIAMSIFSFVNTIKSTKTLLALSFGFGCPIGLKVLHLVHESPGEQGPVLPLIYIVASVISLHLAFCTWQQVNDLDGLQKINCLWIFVSCQLMILVDMTYRPDLAFPLLPSVKTAAGMMIAMATTLKMDSVRAHQYSSESLSPRSILQTKAMSAVPTLGNLATTIAFILLCIQFPLPVTEIWVCGCSLLLFLLQKDSYLLQDWSTDNQMTPTVVVSFLVLVASTVHQSNFWCLRLSLPLIQGACELLVLLISSPIYFVLATVMWRNEFYISDRVVVFLVPLNFLFYFFGSNYMAWVLGTAGLISGTWLMVYRLPLCTDYQK